MTDLPTQQQKLFATRSVMDSDDLLVTATVPVMERFGCTGCTLIVVELEPTRTSHIVYTATGAVTAVDIVQMFQCHATQ